MARASMRTARKGQRTRNQRRCNRERGHDKDREDRVPVLVECAYCAVLEALGHQHENTPPRSSLVAGRLFPNWTQALLRYNLCPSAV
jgi:hypothetical protein